MRRNRIRSFLVIAVTALMMVGLLAPTGVTRADGVPGTLRWIFGSGSATGGKTISFRVTMWGTAPAGGAVVNLTSTHTDVVTIPSQVTIPAGESEVLFKLKSKAVTESISVLITAEYNGVKRYHRVTILRPYLSSMTLQTRIRAGGTGRVTVRLSGIAPTGGVTVFMNSSRPSILPVPPSIFFAAGSASVTVFMPATLVSHDVPVNISALYRGIKITKPTIVRLYAAQMTPTPTATNTEVPTATETSTDVPTATETATDVPTATETATDVPTATETATDVPTATETATDVPTATETATDVPTATPTDTEVPTNTPTATDTPTETATATDTPTETATATDTPTETATATDTPTETATATNTPTDTPTVTNTPTDTPTATSTATNTPTATPTPPPITVSVPPVTTVPRGSTVWFTVCLLQSPSSDVTITWAPNSSDLNNAVNYGSKTILAGATGDDLCFMVSFTGKNSGGGSPEAIGSLIFTINGVTVTSTPITFTNK